LTLENISCFPKVMSELVHTNESDIYGVILPMSHVSGPIIIQELAERRVPF